MEFTFAHLHVKTALFPNTHRMSTASKFADFSPFTDNDTVLFQHGLIWCTLCETALDFEEYFNTGHH